MASVASAPACFAIAASIGRRCISNNGVGVTKAAGCGKRFAVSSVPTTGRVHILSTGGFSKRTAKAIGGGIEEGFMTIGCSLSSRFQLSDK